MTRSRSYGHVRVGLVCTALALAACGRSPPPVPTVDLAEAEPPVATRLSTLRETVAAHRDSAAAWSRLASSLQAHGFVEAALAAYAGARAVGTTTFRNVYLPAVLLGSRADSRAGPLFEQARALRPDYPPLYLHEAEWLLGQGRASDAYRLLEGSAATREAPAHASFLLGRSALALGDTADARERLEAAIREAPAFGDAHAQLAEIYRRAGDSTAAEAARERARLFEGAPPIDDPVYGLVVAEGVSSRWHILRGQARLSAGDPETAVPEFRRATEVLPDDAHAATLLGSALEAAGHLDEAVGAYGRAVELRPGHPPYELNLARAEYRSGDREAGRSRARRALAADSSQSDGYLLLGMFAEVDQAWEKTAQLYVEGLRRAPFDPRIALRLAWIFATSRDPSLRRGQLSVALAERVAFLEGFREPATLDVLSAAYAEYGDWEGAISTADRAVYLARRAGAEVLADQIEQRRAGYARRVPYRE